MRAPPFPHNRLSTPRVAQRHGLAPAIGLGVLMALLSSSCLANEAAVTVSAAAQAGGPLGTLFYSTAERAAIVRARLDQPDAPHGTSVMTVSGMVKRERGNSTTWVNGQPLADGQTLPPAGRVSVGRSGVLIDGAPVRVGESLDLSTRARSDIVAPGAVTVKERK